jgi:hypothetical protein
MGPQQTVEGMLFRTNPNPPPALQPASQQTPAASPGMGNQSLEKQLYEMRQREVTLQNMLQQSEKSCSRQVDLVHWLGNLVFSET